MRKLLRLNLFGYCLPVLHSILGFPIYPGGHKHLEMWSADSHSAFNPHGSALHVSTQLPRRQVWLLLQSGSAEHSAFGGDLHPLSGATRPPSGQMQATARRGNTSTVLHRSPASQGFPRQISVQRPLVHASGELQSESEVHSGDATSLAMQPCS